THASATATTTARTTTSATNVHSSPVIGGLPPPRAAALPRASPCSGVAPANHVRACHPSSPAPAAPDPGRRTALARAGCARLAGVAGPPRPVGSRHDAVEVPTTPPQAPTGDGPAAAVRRRPKTPPSDVPPTASADLYRRPPPPEPAATRHRPAEVMRFCYLLGIA